MLSPFYVLKVPLQCVTSNAALRKQGRQKRECVSAVQRVCAPCLGCRLHGLATHAAAAAACRVLPHAAVSASAAPALAAGRWLRMGACLPCAFTPRPASCPAAGQAVACPLGSCKLEGRRCLCLHAAFTPLYPPTALVATEAIDNFDGCGASSMTEPQFTDSNSPRGRTLQWPVATAGGMTAAAASSCLDAAPAAGVGVGEGVAGGGGGGGGKRWRRRQQSVMVYVPGSPEKQALGLGSRRLPPSLSPLAAASACCC